MTLVLQIENFGSLENGGPVQFTVPPTGARIGRSPSMDWTLPDQTRHISSHHIDIVVQNGAYYLQDVSTNGTFLNGAQQRLPDLHALANGDRFQIGTYIVAAQIAAEQAPEPAQVFAPTPTPAPIPEPAPAPIPEPELAPIPEPEPDIAPLPEPIAADLSLPPISPVPDAALAPPEPADDPFVTGLSLPPTAMREKTGLQQPPTASADAAADGLLKTPTFAPEPLSSPIQAPPVTQAPEPRAQTLLNLDLEPEQSVPQRAPAPTPEIAPEPAPEPIPDDFDPFAQDTRADTAELASPAPQPIAEAPAGPFGDSPAAPVPSVPRPEIAPLPAAAPAPEPMPMPASASSGDDVLRAFCEGAGLDPGAYQGVDVTELARALGKSNRIAAEQVMMLLQARASTKQFTRGSARTMQSSTDNNPLKFLPDVEQVIAAMYLKHRDGFLHGADAWEDALSDIRVHQTAVFAAIQPALLSLLEGLDPDDIEPGAREGSMFGGAQADAAWSTFMATWAEKTNGHENGMLDAFLARFAQAYGDMVDKNDS